MTPPADIAQKAADAVLKAANAACNASRRRTAACDMRRSVWQVKRRGIAIVECPMGMGPAALDVRT